MFQKQAIGKMRYRCQIQEPVTTQDSYGQKVITWTNRATRWVAIQPLTGRELFSAMEVNALLTHTIQMRTFVGLNCRWRIKYCDRIFNIGSIADDLEMLTIMAVEQQ